VCHTRYIRSKARNENSLSPAFYENATRLDRFEPETDRSQSQPRDISPIKNSSPSTRRESLSFKSEVRNVRQSMSPTHSHDESLKFKSEHQNEHEHSRSQSQPRARSPSPSHETIQFKSEVSLYREFIFKSLSRTSNEKKKEESSGWKSSLFGSSSNLNHPLADTALSDRGRSNLRFYPNDSLNTSSTSDQHSIDGRSQSLPRSPPTSNNRESFGNHRESFGNKRESFGSKRESFGNKRESFGSRRDSFGNKSMGSYKSEVLGLHDWRNQGILEVSLSSQAVDNFTYSSTRSTLRSQRLANLDPHPKAPERRGRYV